MKKSLNFYCLLFIFAVGLGISIDFATGYTDMKNGLMEGFRDGSGEVYDYDDVLVAFRPKSFSFDNSIGKDSIYNEITKEKEAVNYDKITVHVPREKSQFPGTWLFGLGCLLYSVGILGFWVVFIKAIRSVKRGDVFLLSVASFMTKAAIFLLLAYAGEWVTTWGLYEYAKTAVAIADYEIVPNFEYSNSKLYVAFGLMLLAQIIKQGKELKEEQELTI